MNSLTLHAEVLGKKDAAMCKAIEWISNHLDGTGGAEIIKELLEAMRLR